MKRRARNRKTLPDHVRQLFMMGSGCNTQYTQAEIKALWDRNAPLFFKHLDSIDRTCSQFEQRPMIFNILNTTEKKERERFGL